jgi:hypothetical protein
VLWEASKAHPSVENSSYSNIAEHASALWLSESEKMKPLLDCQNNFWQPT